MKIYRFSVSNNSSAYEMLIVADSKEAAINIFLREEPNHLGLSYQTYDVTHGTVIQVITQHRGY